MALKKDIFGTDEYWSAFKRKDVAALTAMALSAVGEDEAAEIAKETTRVTDAAVRRIREALTVGEVEAIVEPDEVCENEVEETEEEVVTGSIEEHNEIVEAIAAGKRKKAKKLLKAAIEGGAKGSQIKEFKKQIKAL